MPSDLIPAPELDLAGVAQLRARARRGPRAVAGSPVTLPHPLTSVDFRGEPRIGTPALLVNEWKGWVCQVPVGQCWSLYGLADLTAHDGLAGVRLRDGERVLANWDLNLLHVPQVPATPTEFRQPRLGYLSPPTWLYAEPHGTLTFVLEFLATRPMVRDEGAIVLLGYWGEVS